MRLFGPHDTYLKRLREAFEVDVFARGGELRISGATRSVEQCEAALLAMEDTIEQRGAITREEVERVIRDYQHSPSELPAVVVEDEEELWPGTQPKTRGQSAYVEAMFDNDIVFCIGPAGTGKTYLAVAVALNYLRRGVLSRIVLCRPAVEAGESLGYLPGDMYAKVNPYLRPLYDALNDLMDTRRVRRYIENDIIEVLPLAFVRGRTLDRSFIILDEAQNCTVAQMKTFLTRLGAHAKLVVTGDITQVDLPPDKKSGLIDAQDRLKGVRGIEIVRLSESDIVRHRLVKRILDAYRRQPDNGCAPGQGGDDASG